jgi:hypothetical protein
MAHSERLQLLSRRLILLIFSGFPKANVSQFVSQNVSRNSGRSSTAEACDIVQDDDKQPSEVPQKGAGIIDAGPSCD